MRWPPAQPAKKHDHGLGGSQPTGFYIFPGLPYPDVAPPEVRCDALRTQFLDDGWNQLLPFIEQNEGIYRIALADIALCNRLHPTSLLYG